MRALLAAIAFALLAAAPSLPADAQSRPEFQLIVHSSNPAQSIDRKFVADAFLKKVTRWSDDQVIQPVDMIPSSPVRRAFSEAVLERSVGAVKSYWQQLIFSGRSLPAPELDGDDAVVAYVASHPGAIGYVSGGAILRGVKLLAVR